MVVELRTLRVSSDFDAGRYVAGMNAKIDADRRGAESSKATGAAVEEQKIKVSSTLPLLERLSRQYVDGYGTAAKFNTEIMRLAKAQDTAAISGEHLEQIYAGMAQKFGLQANSTELAVRGYGDLARAIDTVNGRLRQQQAIQSDMRPVTGGLPANDNMAQFRRQNLGFQVQDIGVSLYGGMPVGTVLLQQGSQILGLYQGNGGVNAALKDFGGMIVSATKYLGPFAAAGAAAYGTYKLLASYSVEAGLAVSETTRALAAQAAPIGALQGQIGELTGLQETYNKAIRESAESSSSATDIIIANTEREFNAKRALLELEQKRLQASMEVQRSEIAIAQQQLRAELASTVNTRIDLDRTGYGDSRVGRFVALPDDVTGLDKTREILQSNPLTDKIKELRANLELTEIGAQKLDEALKKTFESSPYGSGDLPIVGPIPGKNPRYDLGGDAKEISRQQSELDRFQRSQEERLETLRAELALVGQSEAARSKTLALLQAEQQIRQMGLNTSSQEAAGIREHAAALAEMGDVLDRQTDAWNRFRSAGENAIGGVVDSLTKGDFKGALTGVAESVQKLLADDLKNSIANCIDGPARANLFSEIVE